MVRNKMNQTDPPRAQVPAAVWIARPVPIDRRFDDIGLVRERIQAGQAYLKVVAYPWGVEFDVCEVEESR